MIKKNTGNDITIEQKIALWEVIKNPKCFTELYLYDRSRGKEIKIFYYQYPLLFMPEFVCRSARYIGKSVTLQARALQLSYAYSVTRTLICSHRKHHVKKICQEIKDDLDGKNDFIASMSRKMGTVSPSYYLPIKNGSEIYGVAGGDDGKNYNSLRVEAILEDETQFCVKEADDQANSIWVGKKKDQGDFVDPNERRIKDKVKAAKGDLSVLNKAERAIFNDMWKTAMTNKRIVRCWYGVPNGLRSSLLYQYEFNDKRFKNKILTIPRYYYPFFTKEQWDDAIQQFHGENTDIFKQQIRGEHGDPCYAVFNMEDYLRCVEYQNGDEKYFYKYKIFHIKKDKILEKQYIADFADLIRPIKLPQAKNIKRITAGIDLGYNPDPTIITLWSEEEEPKTKIITSRLFGMIELTKVEWNRQGDLICKVFNLFNVELAGIDKGGAGISVVQALLDPNDPASHHHCNIVDVNFGESITLKTNYICLSEECVNVKMDNTDNGPVCPNCGSTVFREGKKEETRMLRKEFATDLVIGKMDGLEYIFPDDTQIMEEIGDYRYKVTQRGRSYISAKDHIIASITAREYAVWQNKTQKDMNDNSKYRTTLCTSIIGTSDWEDQQYMQGNINEYGYLTDRY
jgi:hypothetical protein